MTTNELHQPHATFGSCPKLPEMDVLKAMPEYSLTIFEDEHRLLFAFHAGNFSIPKNLLRELVKEMVKRDAEGQR